VGQEIIVKLKSIRSVATIVALGFLGTASAAGLIPEPNANAVPYATKANPETLVLDARLAGRGIAISTMHIPVRPGPFTFVYPKWIPGYHSPAGVLADISQLTVSADGRTLTWRRDKVDMYAFHVMIPAGVHSIKVQFTMLLNGGTSRRATPELATICWTRAFFYQNDINYHHYYLRASIILPKGWGYGTALTTVSRAGQRVNFAEEPLTYVGDSPLFMGRYYRKVQLWHQGDAHMWLDMFADTPQELDVPAKLLAAYKRLPDEAFALYGSRHWYNYHALLAMSNHISYDGIEHHQSSDDRASADFMTNPDQQLLGGDLIPHEFSHSWNGKYRRPWDLKTDNYQIPQRTDLLWVYEGMNQYLGDLLSFRSGIRKPSEYPQYLAMIYNQMATEPGRNTEPLIDLTTGAPYFYMTANGEYPSLRRSAGDFYTEGELLWLDVDTIIRARTDGKKSLDDFWHLYSEPKLTGPITKPYTRADIEHMLNEVCPYDWHAFFQRHVYEVSKLPPTGELERSGWRLVYTAKPNPFITAAQDTYHTDYQWLTYGFNVGGSGALTDVREGSPAWDAGMAPGMKLIAVNGQSFSAGVLKYALRQAQHDHVATRFTVAQDGWVRTIAVSYFGGPRYPHLVRIPGTVNMLARIMAPHAGH
jgi:predicted metalloprotease with PDZ domain